MTRVVYLEKKKSGWNRCLYLFYQLIELFEGDSIVYLPPKHQVAWSDYLNRLAEEDRQNTLEFCRRVEKCAYKSDRQFAVMAVGSTLNKEAGTYRDVDLVLLPCDYANYATERLFSSFVVSQREVVCEEDNQKPFEEEWRSTHWYDHCRLWHLAFDRGKILNIFVYTDRRRMTLEDKLVMEASYASFFERKFAYTVFGPPAFLTTISSRW